ELAALVVVTVADPVLIACDGAAAAGLPGHRVVEALQPQVALDDANARDLAKEHPGYAEAGHQLGRPQVLERDRSYATLARERHGDVKREAARVRVRRGD